MPAKRPKGARHHVSARKRHVPKKRRAAGQTPSSLAFPLLRTFLLASVAVVSAAYGVYRYYTAPRPSMLAPRPAATEIPIEVE